MTPQRYQRLRATLERRQPDLAVILEGVHKPHNIAAILRTCDAVGVLDVHAVLPDNRARPAARRAMENPEPESPVAESPITESPIADSPIAESPIESSMGSQRWSNLHYHDTGPCAVKATQAQGMQVLAAHFGDQAVPYREIDFTRPTALLLGTEKFGVTEAAARGVDQHVMIPMMGMVSSFNVSVAAAIILSEACEQRRRAGLYQRPAWPVKDSRQVLFRWAHPRLARHCERFGVAYPALNEHGEIADPGAFDFALSQAILRHQGRPHE
ncbi:TrmH family RNA methyltransferase [Alloalcanivorax mobilis]|uniref:TrmH family RNA methyltransferase n=1 Tax=Alloalcanivorax mobilis TaxID=2019569 RepID=UPI000C76F99B|nr:TrmH family RNA methyltransferase [Alloalcanivorax mobilis]